MKERRSVCPLPISPVICSSWVRRNTQQIPPPPRAFNPTSTPSQLNNSSLFD
ncbi:hypothetical protein OIU74_006421 [Salix koriyanagi]|uniref:Uncharacterized protein n=1 Tax=Salix koriyanagi TaxID=2511006 RepID=A0A9Q0ZBD2_9ROSI|nr:hypothetical protein OIU74_006421 [Salix koriyanagi]